MKRLLILILGLISFFAYCLYINLFQVLGVQQNLDPKNPSGYYDYRGLTHIHSKLSTGSGTPQEIVDDARDARLDFIFFTEVNLKRRPTELEGYNGRVLVLTGGEYSYLDARLMYYGAPEGQPPEKRGESQVYFTDLMTQQNLNMDQGFVVLAHPLLKNYQMSGEYPPGLTGIEILNLKRLLEASWQSSKLTTIGAFLTYPFNSKLGLLLMYENPQEELQLWDSLNMKNKTIGFFGSDATARAVIFPNTDLKVPSYETIFRVASNHVLLKSELTGHFASDKKKILAALASGQFYIALDVLANPKGFLTEVQGHGVRYPMGSSIDLKENMRLIVDLPGKPEVPFETVIFRDGQRYMTSNQVHTVVDLKLPGRYRVIVRLIPEFPFPFGKRWIPWIYSNSFYVHN